MKTSGDFRGAEGNPFHSLLINQQKIKPSPEETIMAEQPSATHPHRLKMDGSSDSICLNCLATVAAKQEVDQSGVEMHHVCLPSFSVRRTTPLQQSV